MNAARRMRINSLERKLSGLSSELDEMAKEVGADLLHLSKEEEGAEALEDLYNHLVLACQRTDEAVDELKGVL